MSSNIQKVINRIKCYCKKCSNNADCNVETSKCSLKEFKNGENPYKIVRTVSEETRQRRIEALQKAREIKNNSKNK